MGSQRTMSGLIGELTAVDQLFNLRGMHIVWKKKTNFHTFQLFQLLSVCSKSLCIVEHLIWNPAGWNATRTIVYYSRIETDIGIHTLPVTKLKIFSLLLVNFLHEYKLSSLVMTRHMDYWRSYKIKISHLSTYSRNHNIWRHRTNLMCTIIYFYCWQ